ncbi:YycH family regulatory protein [Metabacillus sp. RGM 3146]|uniref:YycH family regulatory protein n=1 Tax=Metabacillus sp. RGM 3146 TaxID=3401092 RepID=UPI003B9D95DE
MKRERVKTITLIFLSLLSIFLTWNIWTFQPNFDYIPKSKYFEPEDLTATTKQLSDVVKPVQIFYHENKQHQGTFDPGVINKVWNKMSTWDIRNSRQVSDQFKNGFLNWVQGEDGKRKVELVFSDEIPTGTFQSIFSKWKDKAVLYSSFDRIVIPLDDDDKNSGWSKIYFVSYFHRQVLEATVKQADVRQLDKGAFSRLSDFQGYFAERITPDNMLMLPKKPLTLNRFDYETMVYNADEFKQVLFTSELLNQEKGLNKVEYTDTSHLLVVFNNDHKMTFSSLFKPSLTSDRATSIQQSIDYLNNHGGWTNQYVFYKIDTNRIQSVSFRLMMENGLPVFPSEINQFGPTDIIEEWGNNDIAQYIRPTYKLSSKLRSPQTTIESGEELMKILQKRTDLYNPENVKRIFPGYEMSAKENMLVSIDPVWFMETKTGLIQAIHFSENGIRGKNGGLE